MTAMDRDESFDMDEMSNRTQYYMEEHIGLLHATNYANQSISSNQEKHSAAKHQQHDKRPWPGIFTIAITTLLFATLILVIQKAFSARQHALPLAAILRS